MGGKLEAENKRLYRLDDLMERDSDSKLMNQKVQAIEALFSKLVEAEEISKLPKNNSVEKNLESIIDDFLEAHDQLDSYAIPGKTLVKWPNLSENQQKLRKEIKKGKKDLFKDSHMFGPYQETFGNQQGVYMGGYKDRKPDGYGQMVDYIDKILESGVHIEAIWQNGKPAHSVIIMTPKGTQFNGSIGQSSMSGTFIKQTASSNQAKPSQDPVKGYEFFPAGGYFKGHFQSGSVRRLGWPVKKKDYGEEIFPDGTIVRGRYENDQKHSQFIRVTADKKTVVENWSNGKKY